MDLTHIPNNPYLLLTPGPLSTTKSVRASMLRDWCTWDDDYHRIVESIRQTLVRLATMEGGYTSVLMQGSGTFVVESVIGSVIPPEGHLLVLANGAYGQRMAEIAGRLALSTVVQDSGELHRPDLDLLSRTLDRDPKITHVGVIHCETTTGMLNPIDAVARIVKAHGKVLIVDAMSSFGGMPLDIAGLGADFLVSSANKCIQGVPGFGFVIAKRSELEKAKGWARSLSLDLYDQWQTMESHHGKWRFTSPTHVVHAFAQALKELAEEGGILKRYERYRSNHRVLVDGMRALGFKTLLADELHSPIITSFLNPAHDAYDFKRFYLDLKARGFVIYPGKITSAPTFRVSNIGNVTPGDMRRFLTAVRESMFWAGIPQP
jgi:2-aminoethylphosphonate-pyruvate transaminase